MAGYRPKSLDDINSSYDNEVKASRAIKRQAQKIEPKAVTHIGTDFGDIDLSAEAERLKRSIEKEKEKNKSVDDISSAVESFVQSLEGRKSAPESKASPIPKQTHGSAPSQYRPAYERYNTRVGAQKARKQPEIIRSSDGTVVNKSRPGSVSYARPQIRKSADVSPYSHQMRPEMPKRNDRVRDDDDTFSELMSDYLSVMNDLDEEEESKKDSWSKKRKEKKAAKKAKKNAQMQEKAEAQAAKQHAQENDETEDNSAFQNTAELQQEQTYEEADISYESSAHDIPDYEPPYIPQEEELNLSGKEYGEQYTDETENDADSYVQNTSEDEPNYSTFQNENTSKYEQEPQYVQPYESAPQYEEEPQYSQPYENIPQYEEEPQYEYEPYTSAEAYTEEADSVENEQSVSDYNEETDLYESQQSESEDAFAQQYDEPYESKLTQEDQTENDETDEDEEKDDVFLKEKTRRAKKEKAPKERKPKVKKEKQKKEKIKQSGGKVFLRAVLSIILIVCVAATAAVNSLVLILRVNEAKPAADGNYYFTSQNGAEQAGIEAGDFIVCTPISSVKENSTLVYVDRENKKYTFGKSSGAVTVNDGDIYYIVDNGAISRDDVLGAVSKTVPSIGKAVGLLYSGSNFIITDAVLFVLCLVLIILVFFTLRPKLKGEKKKKQEQPNEDTDELSENAEPEEQEESAEAKDEDLFDEYEKESSDEIKEDENQGESEDDFGYADFDRSADDFSPYEESPETSEHSNNFYSTDKEEDIQDDFDPFSDL